MAALGVLRAWAATGEPPAADPGPGRLGRRGGRPLRPQPVRQLGLLRDAGPRRARRPARRRRAVDRRGARRERGRARAGAGGGGAARASSPPISSSTSSRARSWRRRGRGRPRSRAAPASSAIGSASGAGLARRHDADGSPPGRRAGGGRGRAAGRGDRPAPRRRRDDRRAVLRPGHPDRGRRRGRAAGRPAPPRRGRLAAMLDGCPWKPPRRSPPSGAASWRRSTVWRIEPIPFDSDLVAAARGACDEVAGSDRVMTSGALHDAAEVARVLPAAMIFCPSTRGHQPRGRRRTPPRTTWRRRSRPSGWRPTARSRTRR